MKRLHRPSLFTVIACLALVLLAAILGGQIDSARRAGQQRVLLARQNELIARLAHVIDDAIALVPVPEGGATVQTVSAVVAAYCSTHDDCRGVVAGKTDVDIGPSVVTPDEIAAVIVSYCSQHNGCAGAPPTS